MIDKPLIEKKLRKIEDFLRELKTVNIESLKDFKENTVVKRFVERNLELSIEQMVDICKHFISGLDLREPETYSECFEIITENGVLSKETLNIFKSMVRFRNILIHTYDGIDDSITYEIYKQRLEDFRTFINSIRAFLQKDH
mgnify:CR=1 FL=1|jgi:uncharacterized protein YutE (UPF0331/DUF86 family)